MHGTITSGFRVEWRPLADLASVAAEWRALAARALEPRHGQPSHRRPPVFGRDAGAGLVWSGRGRAARLGFFPRVERHRRHRAAGAVG